MITIEVQTRQSDSSPGRGPWMLEVPDHGRPPRFPTADRFDSRARLRWA